MKPCYCSLVVRDPQPEKDRKRETQTQTQTDRDRDTKRDRDGDRDRHRQMGEGWGGGENLVSLILTDAGKGTNNKLLFSQKYINTQGSDSAQTQ